MSKVLWFNLELPFLMRRRNQVRASNRMTIFSQLAREGEIFVVGNTSKSVIGCFANRGVITALVCQSENDANLWGNS
jgi:hypothetical protein